MTSDARGPSVTLRARLSSSLWAALSWLPGFALYLWSDQRDVQFWDVGEMQTVPWIFGVAHPTGFPLYVALGFAVSHVLAVGTVAWRMSLLSSLAVSVSAYVVYRLVRDRATSPWIALGSAYLFCVGEIVWSRGTRADVHPVALAFASLAILAVVLWRRTRAERWLLIAAASFGCALATHPVALFIIPALLALAIVNAASFDGRALARVIACALAPLLCYGVIPLRSAQLSASRRDPTLALGLPPGQAFWDYAHTMVPASFLWFLSGAQFHREAGLSGFTNAATFASSAMWLLDVLERQYGFPVLVLTVVGAVALVRIDGRFALALLLAGTCVVPFAFAYGEEADRERYLLLTLFGFATLCGCGASALAQAANRFGTRVGNVTAIVLGVALIGAAGFRAYGNLNVVAIDRDAVARTYLRTLETRTPASAIVVAPWIYATPLAYAAYVEHDFGTRIPVNASLADVAPYLPVWRRTHCVLFVSDRPAPNDFERGFRPSRITGAAPYVFALPGCAITGRASSP